MINQEALRVIEPDQNVDVSDPVRIAGRLRMASICENAGGYTSLLNLEAVLAIEPTHKRAAATGQSYRQDGEEEGWRLLALRLDAVEPRLR